jgi:hypothetical protein
MTVVFQDGEPVDPKKLEDLQTQIDAILLKTNQSYDLSTTTANSISQLSVMHLKAGVVTFETGLKAGSDNNIQIELGWGADYAVAYVVAQPRLKDPGKTNIRWGISGTQDATFLNVWSEKATSTTTPINFHWISAGKKIL